MYNARPVSKKERNRQKKRLAIPSTYGPYQASLRLKEILEEADNPHLTSKIGKWYHRLTYLIKQIATIEDIMAEKIFLHFIKKDFEDHINLQFSKTEGIEKTAWSFLKNVGLSHYRDAMCDIKIDIHEEYLRIKKSHNLKLDLEKN